MRNIKFRMWDFENGQMIDGDSLAFEEYAPISHLLSQKGIMQYTGLTDRNGKEIYEGDIVKGCFNAENRLTTVQWSDQWACWVVAYKEYGLSTFQHLEVIGNIYENPELKEDTP